jgi:4a-hydroxytetrahydrobiopterin dehydratase
MTKLTEKHCVPCEGGTPALDGPTVGLLMGEVPRWVRRDEAAVPRITRHFEFKDFVAAMAFVGKVADLAEAEAHHPDFCVHYNKVDVTLWTHAVGGLSENDFIVAAKIDEIETLSDAPHA